MKQIFSFVCAIAMVGLAPTTALAQTCSEWIELRPKGNWQNPATHSEELRAGSATCIEELAASSDEERLELLDRYLLSAVNLINPDDLKDASVDWSDAAKLKVNAVRAPFIFSPFLPDGDRLALWLEEARRTGDDKALSRFAFYQALYLFRQPDADETEDERDALLSESASAGERGGAMRIGLFALNAQATTARKEGDITRAVRLYQRVLAGSGEDRLAHVHISALADMAYLFYEIGDYDRAVALYDRAINYTDRYPLRRAQSQLNRGLAFAAKGDLPAAEASMQAGLDTFDQNIREGSTESSLAPGRHNAAFELARFQYQQETGDPLETLQRAEAAAEKLLAANYFAPSVPAEAYAWLAEQYLARGDVDKAQSLLTTAETAVEMDIDPDNVNPTDQDRAFLLSFLKTTSAVMRRLGDDAGAARYALAALSLSEERYEREKLTAVGNAALLFEIEEQEAATKAMAQAAAISALELQQAESEAALATAAENRNRIIALSIALFALGTLVLAGAVYRAYRAQKAAAEAQKAVAQAKKTFFDEMHHRVSNNLQMLLSLFRLDLRERQSSEQSFQMTEESAVLRLETMSMIHNILRDQESGTTIDAAVFLEDLLSLFERVLNKPNIVVESDLDHASIDIETAVPLALLINELLTNAYKHAFGDGGGVVSVSFKVDGSRARLSVADNGRGFEPPEESDGLGLGLAEDLAQQVHSKLQRSSETSGPGAGVEWILNDIRVSNQPDAARELEPAT